MGGMKDAFYGDSPAPYPTGPGWKEGGTSRRAARSVGNSTAGMRADVLKLILAAPDGLTADEVAAKMSRPVLAIRPRVTELGQQKRIGKSGRTRKNESGLSAAVWVAYHLAQVDRGDQ